MARIYVETIISAPLEEVWAATQDHRRHARWDVRFGRIDPVPGSAPAAFTYATAVLPGVEIAGHGVHSGERRQADGSATSALRFGSADPRSPIRDGSGYWRYVPVPGGVRFLTGYAYRTRWGRTGRLVDLVFGPAFGWATAWSFDRLRLWLEHGVSPESARRRALTELSARAALVAAAVTLDGRPLVVLLTLGLALGVPPHRHTPAARRCRRRPGRSDPPETPTRPESRCGLESRGLPEGRRGLEKRAPHERRRGLASGGPLASPGGLESNGPRGHSEPLVTSGLAGAGDPR
ncbi:hypothetical protein Aca07nite_02580 [Actinoplanes capillaceus]|uniref:Polyketide cyclase / dehydrase and lipid transport n=1 Tax=Actinoplanes campanulatus TaxID=113559 RepID=A0ABQ3W9Z1_9ACTN|nr:hypothetical protein [Actinoplanes capillaceus]GID42983.1 hypothetical protein Aca07nite_02580 [Actinoplanes capillaceus]